MKKKAFLALVLVLTLCASAGQAALLQGGSNQQKGVMLTTPEPTQAPNVISGLGQSEHSTKTTVMGSDQANTVDRLNAMPEEPVAVATAEPAPEATAEPVVTLTEEELSEGTTYTVKGYAAFDVVIKLDENGNVVFVAVPEHSETPGYGADVLSNAAIFEALKGLYIGDAQVDAVGGATMTVDALNDALAQAAAAYGAEPTAAAEEVEEGAEEPVTEPDEEETQEPVAEPAEEGTQEPAAQEGEGNAPGKRL